MNFKINAKFKKSVNNLEVPLEEGDIIIINFGDNSTEYRIEQIDQEGQTFFLTHSTPNPIMRGGTMLSFGDWDLFVKKGKGYKLVAQ